MDRDDLDDFLDELLTLFRQTEDRCDPATVENTRDRVRIAFIKALSDLDPRRV